MVHTVVMTAHCQVDCTLHVHYTFSPLSSLPSEDGSIASSQFVTPLSTRSQSPTLFHNCTQQDNPSMETVCNSLQRFLEEQQQTECTHRTLEDLEPNASQVTVTPTSDHMSSISDHVIHHVTPLTDHVTPGPSVETMSIRGSEQPVFYIGDIELEMNDDKTENGALNFGFEMSAKSDTEGSYSSTSGSLSPVKPVPRRPGILGVTQASLTVNTGANNQSFSSISTASPQSSMCSHSSHPPSPLTLSPSPTHSCEERPTHENSRLSEITSHENQNSESRTATCESSLDQTFGSNYLCPHQINHRDHNQCDQSQNGKEKVQEEDEWPDLCAESAQTHTEQKAVASLLHADSLPDYVQWNTGVPPPPACQTGYSCVPPNGASPMVHGAYWSVCTPLASANPTYLPREFTSYTTA